MQNTFKTIGIAVCGFSLAGGLLLTSGCSSSRYERSTGTVIDDASLTARVKTDLLRDPLIKDSSINVDTFRGNVQLNGWVNTPEQKKEAEQVATSVNGVQAVQNNLQLKPEAAGASNEPQKSEPQQ